MSRFNPLGIGGPIRIDMDRGDRIEHVIVQRPLDRVLAFTGRSINDVINDPIARNEVRCYLKLHNWVQRESEISDLEHQWNPV
jgi:hypothetical protein